MEFRQPGCLCKISEKNQGVRLVDNVGVFLKRYEGSSFTVLTLLAFISVRQNYKTFLETHCNNLLPVSLILIGENWIFNRLRV